LDNAAPIPDPFRAVRADVDLRALAEKIKAAAASKALSFCATDKGLLAARARSPIVLPCRISRYASDIGVDTE
jgi:hypothetical protein